MAAVVQKLCRCHHHRPTAKRPGGARRHLLRLVASVLMPQPMPMSWSRRLTRFLAGTPRRRRRAPLEAIAPPVRQSSEGVPAGGGAPKVESHEFVASQMGRTWHPLPEERDIEPPQQNGAPSGAVSDSGGLPGPAADTAMRSNRPLPAQTRAPADWRRPRHDRKRRRPGRRTSIRRGSFCGVGRRDAGRRGTFRARTRIQVDLLAGPRHADHTGGRWGPRSVRVSNTACRGECRHITRHRR